MITMHCQKCRTHHEIDEHATSAFDERSLRRHLAGCQCPACGEHISEAQVEAAITVAKESWDADAIYWMGYMMGGYTDGLH